MRDGDTGAPELENLLEHLKQTRGFDFTAYKRTTLSRRIEKRMTAVGVDSYPAYLDYLQVDQGEFIHLFNGILINVTSFFRDADTWDFLRAEIVPKIIEAADRADSHICIWSVGGASGQKYYSLAISVAEPMVMRWCGH